jgi:hypothetical protein
VITLNEQVLLDASLECLRVGCDGKIPIVSVRHARAVIEHRLRSDSAFRLRGICEKCKQESAFSYSQVLDRVPISLRPSAIPKNHFWAVVLVAAPRLASGVTPFVGDRVLVECVQDIGDAWTGLLRSPSAFAPSLALGAGVGGTRFGLIPACTGIVGAAGVEGLPIEWPTEADSAVFYSDTDCPDDLRSAQPVCSNPSCSHFFGLYHSQFQAALQSQRKASWFWDSIPHLILDCKRCGTSTVIDEGTYETLYHV